MAAADTAATAEEALAWEAERRPAAAAIAVAAGVLSLVGTILGGIALRDRPSVTLADALRDAAGHPPRSGGLLTDAVYYVHHKAAELTIAQALSAIAAPLIALALAYLFRAIRARRPELGQAALVAMVIGGVATFVGTLVGQIAVDITSSNFVGSGDHSTAAAHDAYQPPAAVASAFVTFIGHVALGVAFVLIALNAMRVGLLTRFMGVLGIIAGVFLAFPFFSVPVVQAFWLIAMGVLIIGRWPQGVPPAWETGRAEPWPSRQEMLEARGQAAPAASASAPAADLEQPETPAAQQPRAKKKKRRR